MKKQLLERSSSVLLLLFLMLSFQTKAQNVFSGEGVNFVGQINAYLQPANLTAGDYRVLQYRKISTTAANPLDGRGQWATTVNVQSSGGNVTPSNMPGGSGNGWLLTSGPSSGQYNNKWNFTGVGQAGLDAINAVERNASTDMGLNMSTVGRYTFVFKDAGYNASKVYIAYTTNAPVSISHNSGTQVSVSNAIGTITATLSAAPSTQEKFYVRYRTATNDFSSTTNVVEASVAGTTITAAIPAQAATTVYYYIFSSTRTLAQLTASTSENIALSSIRYSDNGGSNYSYVVVATPGQPSAITGNSVICANSAQTYSVLSDPAATSYTWSLPSGWIGSSTTNSINVTANSTPGTVSVVANNGSGTSSPSSLPVSINAGTSITSQPSTTPQTACVGGSATSLSVVADGSVLTYQWYSNVANNNTTGTQISGATFSSYTPSTASAGSLFYYVVVGGACAPTSVTSAVSGAVVVNGLPNDNASNLAYPGGWPSGSNGGGGFGQWSILTSGNAGSFKGGSDFGTAWGLYANGGGSVQATRPFSSPLPVGSNVTFDFDNGFIDNGSTVGVRLKNASGQSLAEFRFVGGGSQYTTLDGSGTGNTAVTYTNAGLNVSIAYTAANTYSIAITKAGVTTILANRTFLSTGGSQIPAQFEFFNNNAGSGSDFDAFLNNLSIGYPKIFIQPSAISQPAVCQNTAASDISVTAYGNDLSYQWYSNSTNSNVGGAPILEATSNVLSPSTTSASTTYYYAVVSYAGAGNCVSSLTSAVSGEVTVLENTTYYADADGDGFGNQLVSTSSCTGTPAGYVDNSDDCNDGQVQYLDADSDGFGSTTMVACNGVTNNTDCDDSQVRYADSDNDGFGSATMVDCGGADNSSDCNDGQLNYFDADGDGFGSSLMLACGGVTNNSDCDDATLMYADLDGDGFGSGVFVACSGVLNASDCNDAVLYYEDADGDGFGSDIYSACNGITNSDDCDDNLLRYIDADGDGFGGGSFVACDGVLNASDCNDAVLYYVDADGDGFGSNIYSPCNGITNSDDCDDSLLRYIDADGDGFGGGSFVACDGVLNASDCNDAVLYYVDADGDGFGSDIYSPCNGITNSDDCDDNLLRYIDADGDGFGGGSFVACDGVLNASDCNDAVLYYVDADGDGFGSDIYSPCNGITNSDDCNDTLLTYVDADNDGFGSGIYSACGAITNSADCNDSQLLYADNDSDGLGSDVLVACGGVANSDDCNDSDPLNIIGTNTYYADADGDGYGNPSVTIGGCTVPAGYVTNSTDCNDSVAAINPGHAEVLYNGVDDNCNGQLDEGFQYTTNVNPSQCGTTLSTINSYIVAVQKANVTAYRFEVTNTATNAVQTIVRTQNYFAPTMFATYAYATSYSIRVEIQRNGIWLGYYGSACLVSTPAVLAPGGAATITPGQCGNTLPTISTLIATTSLAGVTGYKFRVTNVSDSSAPNQVQIIDRGSMNWFSLTMLSTYNYGTTYLVEVAIKVSGVYSNYGSPCAVTAPAVPMLSNCGQAIATKGTLVSVPSKDRVTAYRFEITNFTTNAVTTLDRVQNWFTFNNVPNVTPGGLYGVRVAVMSSGVYSLFSEGCQITAPAGLRTMETSDDFKAVAYPNPFAENFNISVTTASEENFTVKVYDMTGRLLENHAATLLDMQELHIGDRYPSGVYNVILTQGDNVATLRVIKR
jgi:hypothetical protein